MPSHPLMDATMEDKDKEEEDDMYGPWKEKR
jgi:hypothetical protein